jgi:hypothetical protein
VQYIAVFILVGTLLFTLGYCARTALSADREAISTKLIFLLGFAYFQPLSAIYSILTGNTDVLYVDDPGTASMIFAVLCVAFIAVFLFAYSRGWGVRRLACRPTMERQVTTQGLVASSVISLVLAFICRDLIGTTIPVLGVLTFQLASGMYVSAVGFAAWAWFENPRRVSTTLWLLTVLVTVLAAFLAVEWSRRGMISTFIAVPWVGYYCIWRYMPRTRFLKWFAIVAICGFIPVTFQSALRVEAQGGGGSDKSSRALGGLAGYLDAVKGTRPEDFLNSLVEFSAAQFAGSNSVWLIEEYPKIAPYFPLHQFYYLAVHPVPRILWPEKPAGLGREMVIVGGIQRVGDEHNLGPGIIGHCWVDFIWISLPLYATLLGLWFRYLDERASRCAALPYVIIPIGAGTAHIFGIPRGESALFTFNAIAAITGAIVAARASAYLFARPTGWIVLQDSDESNDSDTDLQSTAVE